MQHEIKLTGAMQLIFENQAFQAHQWHSSMILTVLGAHGNVARFENTPEWTTHGPRMRKRRRDQGPT